MDEEAPRPAFITLPPGLLPTTPAANDEAATTAAPVHTESATRRMPTREPSAVRPPTTAIPFVTPPAAVQAAASPTLSPPVDRAPVETDFEPVAAPVPLPAPMPAAAPVPNPSAGPSAEPGNDETRLVGRTRPSAWRLVLPSGESVAMPAALFVGRNPTRAVRDIGGGLLAVDDTTKSVSKTHALLEVVHGQLFVTDLDSTNGVYVSSADTDDIRAVPMERTLVPPGSDLELGAFVIQVEQG